MQSTHRIQLSLFLILTVPVTMFLVTPVSGQVVLYDNLDNVRAADDWFTPLGPDVRFAQQFHLGEHANIDQFSILLQRPQAGVNGSVRFELWRDNGSGKPVPVDDPTGKVADLGKLLDVTQVPIGEFGLFAFDNLVLGLEPNTPYWIVTDNEEVRGISGGEQSVGFAQIYDDPAFKTTPAGYDATAGTNGAGYLHAYRNQDPFWNNLRNQFGAIHLYKAMRVEASEGLVLDIDVLSSAVRQSLTDAQYDINQDGAVDSADRVAWLEESAKTTFGDANLDGVFTVADMTLAFSTREYEDNITLNSTWAEGDWNGDGDFDSGDLALANTLIGDTNLDGTVDFPDFLTLSAGFGNSGGWGEGDFDGNGQVEFPDFLALSANFGQSSGAAASVPEPSSLCLLSLAILAITGRRQSRLSRHVM